MPCRIPGLVQMYIRNCLIGFALSATFVAGLLWLDIAGLYGLVTSTSGGLIAVIMLFVFNGLVFAGVQFAISIMLLPRDDDDSRGNRAPEAIALPIPVSAPR